MLQITPAARAEQACIVPDNGAGTADHPADCPYVARPGNMMSLSAGMPAGTTVQIAPTMHDFLIIITSPGGTLGGEIAAFTAELTLDLQGTGALAGYARTATMQTVGYFHTAPRTPGEPVQDFDMAVFQLIGTINGDPDFCEIDLRAGIHFGLPSPGHTTFTLQQGGDFDVLSTLDLNWELTWSGCPESALAGLGGIDAGVAALAQGSVAAVPAMAPAGAAGLMCALLVAGGMMILRRSRPAAKAPRR
jgi:hypothetical protein